MYASNFITTSDRRAKENIKELQDCSKSLDLNFYEFDYKTGGHSAGHVAQEVQEVYPKFVHGKETETEHLSVDYTGLHSMQIKALKNKCERLEDENKSLQSRIEKLEKLIEKLL
jgi:Na+/phosphate symporter